ncbi:MAG: methyltransferase domain-containing protein [Crenarchaeota archaeon]|nr:methyltransferase domain-containing protein [Thermoproteota archaeon]
MIEVSAILSIREEFSQNIVLTELESLAELYNITIEQIDLHNRKAVLRGREEAIFEMTCRSMFIKSIEVNNMRLTFPRSFLIASRPLNRVDTASSPLEVTLSRILLNLSKVKEGYRVLDPFSGVGGILFEARMLGAHVVGIDISRQYLKVQNMNLVDGDQILSDSSTVIPMRSGSFDALVSDPPYSKLSLIDVDLDILYRNLAKICGTVLKKGGRVAVSYISSISLEDYLEMEGLEVLCLGYQYVHKTLIRKIVCAIKV